ncbi:hypothetical protein JOM56_002881, partial [Amanita muscaria]
MDTPHDRYTKIRHLRHHAIICSLLCLYLFLHHISEMPPKSEPKKASWNSRETEDMIAFLHSEYQRTGNTSFTQSTFVAAAARIQALRNSGVAKTYKHCQSKWRSLKAQFAAADRLASSSGAGASYDPQMGVDATTPSEQNVIDEFATKNSDFKSAGFPFYESMRFVIPS